MLAEIPAGLFREWQLYWLREPWGGKQEDLRAGYLCSLLDVANQGQEAREPKEFFSSLRPPGEETPAVGDFNRDVAKVRERFG